MGHVLRLLAAAATVALVLVPAGGGYVVGGVPWPSHTVTAGQLHS